MLLMLLVTINLQIDRIITWSSILIKLCLMIVVTLGTINFQFDRIITWLNILIEQGIISESVFVQHGATNVSLLKKYSLVKAEPMLESKKLIALVDQARLVVSHAGQGSTRMLAARKASFILVPRLKCYAEHIDNHQLWFAEALEELGVIHCLSLETFKQFISQPPPRFNKKLFDEPKLANYLLSIHSVNTLKVT